jgi:hypothetical protein
MVKLLLDCWQDHGFRVIERIATDNSGRAPDSARPSTRKIASSSHKQLRKGWKTVAAMGDAFVSTHH